MYVARSVRVLAVWVGLAGCLALAGCGGAATAASAGNGGLTVAPPPPTPAVTTAYAHFGDSVTCGAGTSAIANGYAALMDATVAGPNTNFCNPGDQAADTALLVYAHANPTTASPQTFTDMTGTNDVWLCGTYPGCVENYTEELAAGLVWLALPESDKVFAQRATERTGTWENDDRVRPGLGLASAVAGSSVTIPLTQSVAGRQVYVAWQATDGSAASATVAIDGQVVDTAIGYSNPISAIRTQHGVTSTVFLKAYPLRAVGQHTLTVTVQPGAPAGDPFTLLWCGVSSATYTQTGIPHLVAGGILSENYGLRTDVTALYDGVVQRVVNGLKADGMDVQFAALHSVLVAPDDYVDILHPNDAGHAKIAQAFLHPQ